jgi:hypothetical protein
MDIFIWAFLSYGLMNIMVFGSIFRGFREFFENTGKRGIFLISPISKFIYGIISCPMCFSTWGGFFLGFFIYSPTLSHFGLCYEASWFFDGIFSSGIVWAINAIIETYENKTN